MSLLSGCAFFPFLSFFRLFWLVKVALMGLVLLGQDKWRNLHVMANGLGSRHQGRVVSKSVQPKQRRDDNSLLVSTAVENDIEVLDPKPLASSGDALEDVGCEKPICR